MRQKRTKHAINLQKNHKTKTKTTKNNETNPKQHEEAGEHKKCIEKQKI